MYAQLGNIVYEGVNSFEGFSRNDETTYAQFDLVNVKPRLQPIGNNLEEISITLKFRAEFTSPTANILALKKSKDQFEVLPLLMGTGRYVGDYVITSMSEAHDQAWMDGTLIEATIALSLKEYVVADKLQQQQIAARKQAFAVGDKKPIHVAPDVKASIPKLASIDVSAINAQSAVLDRKAAEWEHNVSARTDISSQVETAIKKTNDSLDGLVNKIQRIYDPLDDRFTAISSSIARVKSFAGSFRVPITDINTLRANNRDFQDSIRKLNTSATVFTNPVILRLI